MLMSSYSVKSWNIRNRKAFYNLFMFTYIFIFIACKPKVYNGPSTVLSALTYTDNFTSPYDVVLNVRLLLNTK